MALPAAIRRARPLLLSPCVVFLGVLLAPADAAAQDRARARHPAPDGVREAVTYQVRFSDGAYGWRGQEEVSLPDLAVPEDADALTVIQGPEFAYAVREGQEPTVSSAHLTLKEGVPVLESRADVLVRGWRTRADAFTYGDVSVELSRGDRDRDIAGRAAEHYVLRASVERTSRMDDSGQELAYTSHFWVLPDVPFSWAPFAHHRQSIPGMEPRLRDALTERLEPLGLVARATTRMEFAATLPSGESLGGSERISAFEIADLAPASTPPAPAAPVVSRALLRGLMERIEEQPGATCRSAMAGELPGDLVADTDASPDMSAAARERLAGAAVQLCSEPELYALPLRPQIRADTASFCERALATDGPAALAEAFMSDDQRAPFMELLDAEQRQSFYDEVLSVCQ